EIALRLIARQIRIPFGVQLQRRHRDLAGVVERLANTYGAGKALYDPGKITVPTLLLHAEWDADLPSYQAQGYFAQLTHTPYKRLIELSEGTHTVMMEKNRMQFFHELMGFLDEERPLALK